jgi:hypothetical protein
VVLSCRCKFKKEKKNTSLWFPLTVLVGLVRLL